MLRGCLITLAVILMHSVAVSGQAYRGFVSRTGWSGIGVFTMDENANIAVVQDITGPRGAHLMPTREQGDVAVARGPADGSNDQALAVLNIDKFGIVRLRQYAWSAGLYGGGQYRCFFNGGQFLYTHSYYDSLDSTYQIVEGTLRYTGNTKCVYWSSSYPQVSKIRNTLLLVDKKLIVYCHLSSAGTFADDPTTFSIAPAQPNYDGKISPDGRTYVAIGPQQPAVTSVRINDDGTASLADQLVTLDINLTNPYRCIFNADSRFLFVNDWMDGTLFVFQVGEDSHVAYIARYFPPPYEFLISGDIAVTPDGNFLLLTCWDMVKSAWCHVPARLNHDGSIVFLFDKEFIDPLFCGYPSFIPPQVLCEYVTGAQLPAQNAGRPAIARLAESLDAFTTGAVPQVFDTPYFSREFDGSLAILPTSANCFGYWQSPEDACMAVPYSVYRSRVVLQGLGADRQKMAGIRLRANAQTFQQADTLSVNSLGDAHLSPWDEPTTYTMFFEPPISSCSREELLDDVFLSLDLMAFDPADDVGTSIVLSYCLVDRYPVDALTSWTLVREYSFDTSTEGWSLAGAPEEFSMPDGTYDPTSGTLILRSTNNTNCFGYWHSDADDIVTSTCGELYRATFEVHTDITDHTKVPEIRFRINTEDGQLGVSHSIQSTIDSEMSPYFDAARPSRTFTYNVYLWKPPATYQDKLIVICDLLNFSPDDSPDGAVILNSVRVIKHPLPEFPMD